MTDYLTQLREQLATIDRLADFPREPTASDQALRIAANILAPYVRILEAAATKAGYVPPPARLDLSAEAMAIIAGAVADSSHDINVDGIHGAWPEVQTAFPARLFWDWAKANGHPQDNDGTGYDPDAGE